MAQSAFSVRMDSNLKSEFSSLCNTLGLPVSVAFTLFAKAAVREQRIPFEISANVPNATTRRTIKLAEQGKELNGPFHSIKELRASLDV